MLFFMSKFLLKICMDGFCCYVEVHSSFSCQVSELGLHCLLVPVRLNSYAKYDTDNRYILK